MAPDRRYTGRVATYSGDLRKFQELEEQYRRELADYETEAATYKSQLQLQPDDPELLKRYALVEEKGRQARRTYDELEQLRRALLPGAVA
jgi:hypothetical protein